MASLTWTWTTTPSTPAESHERARGLAFRAFGYANAKHRTRAHDCRRTTMSTARQKEAARRNLEKARAAQRARRQGKHVPRSAGLSTAGENRMSEERFAFPEQRKEPLTDAEHVRNAIARFDQVEDVSD